MAGIDAGIVFLPRFTTLAGETEFTTAPVDVSRQGGAQFQVWRGPILATGGTPSFQLHLQESLDAESWALGPSTPQAIPILENVAQFLSYSFRLRWFRLKVVLAGEDPIVSCWAEGLLRGGDGGMWGVPGLSPGGAAGTVLPVGPGEATRPMPGMAAGGDPWAQLRNLYRFSVLNPGGYLQQAQLERAWRQAM
jgi:hypothetical protein